LHAAIGVRIKAYARAILMGAILMALIRVLQWEMYVIMRTSFASSWQGIERTKSLCSPLFASGSLTSLTILCSVAEDPGVGAGCSAEDSDVEMTINEKQA
jgi:hypothetical protein